MPSDRELKNERAAPIGRVLTTSKGYHIFRVDANEQDFWVCPTCHGLYDHGTPAQKRQVSDAITETRRLREVP